MPVQLGAEARARTASAIRANRPGQSPALDCRNSRVAGYQGLSSRLSSHRHSGACMSATKVGRPNPAREVSDRGARGNDKIKVHHHRGRVEKRAPARIEALAQRFDPVGEVDRGDFLDAAPLLQRDEAHVRNIAQHGEFMQPDRAQLVQIGAAGVLPGDPDLEAMGAETLSPGGDALGLGRQERPVLRHRVRRRAEDAGNAHDRSPTDIARPLQERDVGHDALHPRYRPQQRLQRRPGPQRDPIS